MVKPAAFFRNIEIFPSQHKTAALAAVSFLLIAAPETTGAGVFLSLIRECFVTRSVPSEAVSKQVRRRYEGGTKQSRSKFEQKLAKLEAANVSFRPFCPDILLRTYWRRTLFCVSLLLIPAPKNHPKQLSSAARLFATIPFGDRKSLQLLKRCKLLYYVPSLFYEDASNAAGRRLPIIGTGEVAALTNTKMPPPGL